jgi:hypothetical protein
VAEIEEVADLLGRVVGELEQAAVLEIDSHDLVPSLRLLYGGRRSYNMPRDAGTQPDP